MIDRSKIAQGVIGARCIALTSSMDGSERIYSIGSSDAYSTMLHPLSGDCSATNVGTRALIDLYQAGMARPCSAIHTDTGQAAYERDLSHSPTYHDGSARPAWADAGQLVRWSWSRPYAGAR